MSSGDNLTSRRVACSCERFKMSTMKKSLLIVGIVILLLGLRQAGVARAWQDDEKEGPMSQLRFVVLKDYNGKPVRNAAIVLHPVNRNGQQTKGGMELKTDNDGRTNIDGIPYGPLRVQVLAQGFQTFGQDYQIDKPDLEITVKLKRPGPQYSASGDTKKPDQSQPPEQKPQ